MQYLFRCRFYVFVNLFILDVGDDSSDSDVEENYKDVSKSQLILKVEIQAEEIRQLRSEVARLKSLKILNEGYVKKFFPTKEDEGQMRNGIKKNATTYLIC
ncbi:uncharacterized protein LOC124163548 [Ischnura elegans]|uniref:uncharacterized protein LOC124163548 n=1 Tax=Ischnura elegans TaxID=197161 RepID=UPI001ED8BE0F|nr:uncharacterized protein LOC124163548 [Ischnura elegans]